MLFLQGLKSQTQLLHKKSSAHIAIWMWHSDNGKKCISYHIAQSQTNFILHYGLYQRMKLSVVLKYFLSYSNSGG